MNKIIRNSLSPIIMLVLIGCIGPSPGIIGDIVKLTVQTQNGSTTFSQPGESITYNYTVTNGGATPLGGPVIVSDGTKKVTCIEVNTVGNKDNYLDPNETVTCSAPYTISQTDFTTGSVTNVATATVGGVTSLQKGITLTLGSPTPSPILKLVKTSSSATYGQAGESITYTYTITNTGANPLGPAQFTVTDNKLGAPLNCGEANTTLAPNQSVSCIGTYSITQADMNLANVTNSATASGAGQTSAAATVTIANLAAPITAVPTTPAPPSNLTPLSTIYHPVAKGEWLFQIVRCYGATYSEVLAANPQIRDPDLIYPANDPNGTTVTVPRIGSGGKIYGPPCVVYYTVGGGGQNDNWDSIAQRYNACMAVFRRANPGANPVTLAPGTLIKIPINSLSTLCGTGIPPAVTPVVVVTTAAPPVNTVMRITFDAGQTTAARVGIINPNETLHYVVNANQGQMLHIKLTAPANEVAIGVNGPTGLLLKPLDASPEWSALVTTGGDHYINMTTLGGGSSKSYTLEVSLTAPAATNTPGP